MRKLLRRSSQIALVVATLIFVVLLCSSCTSQQENTSVDTEESNTSAEEDVVAIPIETADEDEEELQEAQESQVIEVELAPDVLLDSDLYTQASEEMDAGNYADALDIFMEISDYEDSELKILQCKYAIGIEAMDSEDWSSAIEQFDGLDYDNSAELLDVCVKEQGMHENADYQFLEAIAESILDRIEKANATDNPDRDMLVKRELIYLEPFVDETFYDSRLQELMQQYIDGLYLQQDALDTYGYVSDQIQWQEGILLRYETLQELYDDYDFLNGNIDLLSVIGEIDSQRKLLDALVAIEEDLQLQLDSMEGITIYRTGTTVAVTFDNNTGYAYSADFTFSIYDTSETLVRTSEAWISGITAYSSYEVSFDVPNSWSDYTFNININDFVIDAYPEEETGFSEDEEVISEDTIGE